MEAEKNSSYQELGRQENGSCSIGVKFQLCKVIKF